MTKFSHYPNVLGLPSLCRHDGHVGFTQNTLTFDSEFCLYHCCTYSNTVMIKGILIPSPEKPNIAMIAGWTFTEIAKKKEHFALTIYAIDQALHTYEVRDRACCTTIYIVVPELRTD